MKFHINYSIRGVKTMRPLYHVVEASSAEELATISNDIIKEQIAAEHVLARMQGVNSITIYRGTPKVEDK
jgi:hypothetical protein